MALNDPEELGKNSLYIILLLILEKNCCKIKKNIINVYSCLKHLHSSVYGKKSLNSNFFISIKYEKRCSFFHPKKLNEKINVSFSRADFVTSYKSTANCVQSVDISLHFTGTAAEAAFSVFFPPERLRAGFPNGQTF